MPDDNEHDLFDDDKDSVLLIDKSDEKQKQQHPHQPDLASFKEPHLTFLKVGTAVMYALASFFITVVNKSVLTSYEFPSFLFLAFGQMLTTVVVLFVGKKFSFFTFPNFHLKIFRDIFPLPLINFGNTISGLGSTKQLSLPMLTMLRRMSVLMTMAGEFYILHVKPNIPVQISVGMMMMGAFIAAMHDLGFNLYGYVYVMLNNIFTASNNIYTKQKLDSRKEIGKYGLLFYNSLSALPFLLIILWHSGDMEAAWLYPHWSDLSFVTLFLLSCTMGFILNYTVMLCTQFNSALTTTIVGCLKNIFVTYLGMFIGGDYIYSLENFIGINISVLGSLLYTYVTFRPATSKLQFADGNRIITSNV